jgi:hypothetical protein
MTDRTRLTRWISLSGSIRPTVHRGEPGDPYTLCGYPTVYMFQARRRLAEKRWGCHLLSRGDIGGSRVVCGGREA